MIEILDPTGEIESRELPMASRLDALDGAVIGLLDNRKPNASAFLSRIEELFAETYPGISVIRRQKRYPTSDAGPRVLEELARQARGVVNAFGD
ncbi:MAG: hypothetical protein M1358_04880 [Chloroflexi bacterium]|nr:hypothetical protein [Chloroflexota bacterium]